MKLSKYIKNNTPQSIVGILLGIGIFAYSPQLLVVLGSLFFLYCILDRKFSTSYVNSKLLLAALSVFTYTGIVALIILITSSVFSINLNGVLLITFLLLIVCYLYEKLIVKEDSPKRATIGKGDVVSVSITIVAIFCIGMLPLLNGQTIQHHSNVLLTLTGNVDNGVHLAIYNDYIGSTSNRIWDESYQSRSDTGGFYPTSWHGANAAIIRAILPTIQPGIQTIISFSILYLFWVGMLVFLTSKLCLSLFHILNKSKKIAPITYVAISMLMLLSVYYFTAHLLKFGFFSFIPQLLAILVILYCLQQIAQDGLNRKGIIGLAVIYIAISLASWILLLPVVMVAVLIVILISPGKLTKKNIFQELKGGLPYYLTALSSIFAQLWLILTVQSQGKVGVIEGLLLDGGTPIYDPLVYLVLFSGLAGALYIAKNKKELYKPVLALVLSTLAFCCFVFIIQAYYTGANHYYFYKSLLILPVILVPFGIASFGIFIQKTYKLDAMLAVFLAISAPLAILIFIPSDKGMLAYMHGSQTVSDQVNQSIYNETKKTSYPTDMVTIYLVGTNESSDIASLLVQANRPHNDCFENLRLNQVISKITQTAVKELTDATLPESCKNESVKFIIGHEYKDLVPAVLPTKYKVELMS